MSAMFGASTGHFVLESGLHTDRWFDLDALFSDPSAIAASVDELATLLAPFEATAICGPMVGGAFLAQALATRMGLHFLHTQRSGSDATSALFATRYELPQVQRDLARGRRVAIVDDMISAGSSTRATHVALNEADAVVVAIGTLHLSGNEAEEHFSRLGLPLVAIERHALELWRPDECPLCRRGLPIIDRQT
jgi:orotate phosphoribosyltransferase